MTYELPTFLLAPRASLYYLQSFTQFPAVYLKWLIYQSIYIYDAHDFYSRITEIGKPDFVYQFKFWLESKCVKHSVNVVTVCGGIAALQRQTFGRGGIVVRNCQDSRIFVQPTKTLRETLGLLANSFLMVVGGNAKNGQAIQESLEALLSLPNSVHIAFVGRRYDPFESLIQANGLENRAHIIGPINPSEVVPFISSADASLILYYSRSVNYHNALPNGLFQTISAELPTLYPELPEIKRIVEHYQFGIPIDPKSPSSICDAVESLFASKEKLNVFKKNVREAGQKLNWEREELILKNLIYNAMLR